MEQTLTIEDVRRGLSVFVGGTYIVNDGDSVLYVGRTNNFRSRFYKHMSGDSQIGRHLKANLPEALSWEITVIDNNSATFEAELISKYEPVFNTTLNTALARQRKHAIVTAATGEVVSRAFDPNILAGTVRASTIAMYKKAFGAYLAFAGSWTQALSPSTLALWRTELANQTLSPNSVNRMLASVRSVMKSAGEQGYIGNDLAQAFDAVRGVKVGAMKGKLKSNARTRITPEDMRRLCNAPGSSTLVGKFHTALLLTMASSGARCSEVVTLKPAQIETRKSSAEDHSKPGEKMGYIILVSGKTDTSNREAPLSSEAYEAIQAWVIARSSVGISSEFIFTGFSGRGGRGPRSEHVTTEAAWQTVKRYATACKLDHIKPHDFRRFVGTNLAKKDPRQAQKALGHKSIDTTYKHYVLDEMEVGLTDGLF